MALGLQKYDPDKVSKTRKWVYTFFLLIVAPYSLLLSLLFIQTVWSGRIPFSKGTGKLKSYKELKDKEN